MKEFLTGALTASAWVVALCFLRSWRVVGERLFLFFAIAFFVLGLHWLGMTWVAPAEEARHYFYLVRLAAFLLILGGIVDKNRRG